MTVSVLLPAYNAAAFIHRALDSAVAQTLPAAEIIVVDDASTDNTAEVVRAYAERHPEVKVISLERNAGPSRARNVGIDAATGDYVALLDADDAWKGDRLEHLMGIAGREDADFVADNQTLYDLGLGQEVRPAFPVGAGAVRITVDDLFRNDIVKGRSFHYALLKPLMRRSFLLRAGLRYREDLREGEDFQLYAQMLFEGAVAYLSDAPLYVYSTRVGSVSGVRSAQTRTSPNSDMVVRASDELVAAYRTRITPELMRLIDRRRAEKWSVHLMNAARDYRRGRRWADLARLFLRNPVMVQLHLQSALSKSGLR